MARHSWRSLAVALAALAAAPLGASTASAQAPQPLPPARTAPRPRTGPPPAPRPAPVDPVRVAVNGGVVLFLVGCLLVTAARRRRGLVPAWHVKAAFGVTLAGTVSSTAGLLGTDGAAGRLLLYLSIPLWLACVAYFVVARRSEKRALAAAVAARRHRARGL